MALFEIGGMRGDLVSDDAFLDVVAVRQPEMLDRLHSHYPSARTKKASLIIGDKIRLSDEAWALFTVIGDLSSCTASVR
jgi:hypothetical protein